MSSKQAHASVHSAAPVFQIHDVPICKDIVIAAEQGVAPDACERGENSCRFRTKLAWQRTCFASWSTGELGRWAASTSSNRCKIPEAE